MRRSTLHRRFLLTILSGVALVLQAAIWITPADASPLASSVTQSPVHDRMTRYVAGMLLEVREGRVWISEVTPGSQAASAGLLPGDLLLVVNDVNIIDLEPLSPEAVLELFEWHRGNDPNRGQELRLVVGRGPGTLTVNIPRPRAGIAPTPPSPTGALSVGVPAPVFTGFDLRGEEVTLEEFRGLPLLIDFWASWCPPCRKSAITLRRLADQYGDKLSIVGVSLDEDPRAFEAFVLNNHLPGKQIHDGGPSGPVARLYGATTAGIPYSVLIGPDGRVAAVGPFLHDKEEEIARLVAAAAGRDIP